MKITANFRVKGGHVINAASDDLAIEDAIKQIRTVIETFSDKKIVFEGNVLIVEKQ